MNVVQVAMETVGKETADTNQLCGFRVETSACISMSEGEVSECESISKYMLMRDGEGRNRYVRYSKSHKQQSKHTKCTTTLYY